MKHVYGAGAFMVLVLAAALWFGPSRNPDPPLVEGVPQSPAGSTQRKAALEQSQTPLDRERVQQLEAMVSRQAQMAAATRDMPAARQRARAEAAPAWTRVLITNQEAYQLLLAQAQKSDRGEVTCTICDGFSYMPCVLCTHHDGKCIDCRGAAYIRSGVLCPSCLGSGKCYLCTGSGKMFCPFCDDGMILKQWPAPAKEPPLH